METITINLSEILYYVIIYYLVFNILTILFAEKKVIKFNNLNSILNILNPFREWENFNETSGMYACIMLGILIPYGGILVLIDFIQSYSINIIW